MRRDPCFDLLPASVSRNLTVYVCDGYPAALAFWRAAIDSFAARHNCTIRLLSQEHGRIEDLLGSEPIDLIFHSAMVLSSLPAGSLLAASGEPSEWDAIDLVPPVAAAIAVQRQPGLPFALSVLTLYRRVDLLAKAGVATGSFTGLADFLDRMAAVERNLPGVRGCMSWTAEQVLRLGRALYDGVDGLARLNQTRAAEVLGLLRESTLAASELALNGGDVDGFFAARSCGFGHQSFLAIEALTWTGVARQPMATAEWPAWAFLLSLAVTACSRHQALAMELMRSLGSVETQTVYAALGGHVPASMRACAAVGGEHGAFIAEAMPASVISQGATSFSSEAMPVVLRCLRGGLDPQQGASALAQLMRALGGQVIGDR